MVCYTILYYVIVCYTIILLSLVVVVYIYIYASYIYIYVYVYKLLLEVVGDLVLVLLQPDLAHLELSGFLGIFDMDYAKYCPDP